MVAALRLGLFFLFPPKEENDSSILNNQRRGISFFIPISKQKRTVDRVRTLIKIATRIVLNLPKLPNMLNIIGHVSLTLSAPKLLPIQ